MKSWYRAVFVLLALVLPAAPDAHAQQPTHVGSFVIVTEADSATREDRSRALVLPAHGRGEGMVLWQCVEGGGATVGVSFGEVGSDAGTRRVVWHFDEDQPDTASLGRMSGDMLWYLPAEDVVPFILRARGARRLAIRVPADAGGSPRAEQVYDLAEPGAALDRLPCTRGTPVAGRPERRWPVQGMARGTPPAVSRDEGVYELGSVAVLLQILNRAEVARMLDDGFPAALRGAGVSGTVVLRFRMQPDGRVDPSSVSVKHSTHEAFNEPAITAARSIVARPAMVNGQPVMVWVEMPLTFAADEPVPAPAAAPPPPVR